MKVVDTQSALEAACAALLLAPRLYIDTEFESSRDGTLLSLVQVTSGAEVFLIDALELRALEPLAALLAGREWVLHAGQQDVQLLVDRLRLGEPPPLFDTQLAWALVGPEYSVSLAYLQYRLLGLRSGKAHQADDWKRRPLPASQLAYAAADVEHLPALYDRLVQLAGGLGRGGIVHEASREAVWPDPEPPVQLSLSSFRNAWQLDADSQAALRRLVAWYNELPEGERRYAPEPKTLLAIAGRLPETGADLARIKGVPRRFAADHGDHLAGLIMRATAEANSADFVPIDPPPYATFEDIRLDGWLSGAKAALCEELCIAPELAFPGRVLRPMRELVSAHADGNAGRRALVGWRDQVLGEAFSAYVARRPPDLGRRAS